MPLTYAQLDRRAALETVDRADLTEWQSAMATKLSDFLRAEYLSRRIFPASGTWTALRFTANSWTQSATQRLKLGRRWNENRPH